MKLCIVGEDRQRCQERPLLSPAAGNRRRRRQRRRRAADSLQLLWPIWPQKPEWWENRESDRGWKWRWSRPRRLQAGCPPPHPPGRQGPHVPCSSFRPRRSVGRVWPALGEQPSAAFADIFKAMSVAIPRTLSQTARHFFCSSILSFSRNRRLWLNKYGLYIAMKSWLMTFSRLPNACWQPPQEAGIFFGYPFVFNPSYHLLKKRKFMMREQRLAVKKLALHDFSRFLSLPTLLPQLSVLVRNIRLFGIRSWRYQKFFSGQRLQNLPIFSLEVEDCLAYWLRKETSFMVL